MYLVGGPATAYSHGADLGVNQYACPTYSIKVCSMSVGNITTTTNKGRQAEPMSGLFL